MVLIIIPLFYSDLHCLVTLSIYTAHGIFPRCIFHVMRWKDCDLGVVCVNKLRMGVSC